MLINFKFITLCGLVILFNQSSSKVVKPADRATRERSQFGNIFYSTYLESVWTALNNDESIQNQVKDNTISLEDIRSGKAVLNLDNLSREIRDSIDLSKRNEVERIRQLYRAKSDLEDDGIQEANINVRKDFLKDAMSHLHVDAAHDFSPKNKKFTSKDIQNLMSQSHKDLENFDQARHKRFKMYELHKKVTQDQKYSELSDDEKKVYNDEMEKREQAKSAKNINHPGSKQFFEDIWNYEDGYEDGRDFNANEFFDLHDLNGDGMLDINEVEGLMDHELKKMFPDDDYYDMVEMEEERQNMREHLFTEIDQNEDGMISRTEYEKFVASKEFSDPDLTGYKTIFDQLKDGVIYTHDDLIEYSRKVKENELRLLKKIEELQQSKKNTDNNMQKLDKEREIIMTNHDPRSEKAKNMLKIVDDKEVFLNERKEKMLALHDEIKRLGEKVKDMQQSFQFSLMDHADDKLDKQKQEEARIAGKTEDEIKSVVGAFGTDDDPEEYMKNEETISKNIHSAIGDTVQESEKRKTLIEEKLKEIHEML